MAKSKNIFKSLLVLFVLGVVGQFVVCWSSASAATYGKAIGSGSGSGSGISPDGGVTAPLQCTRDAGTCGTPANPLKIASGSLNNAWAIAASAFIQGKLPTLTQCEYLKLGDSGNGSIKSTSLAVLSGYEGGGFGTNGGGASVAPITQPIFQTPKSGPWGFSFRGYMPVPASGKTGQVGLFNAGLTHGINLFSDFATSTTNFVLDIIGSSSTKVTFSSVADANVHDFTFTGDGTTITIYVDGVSKVSTTTLTNLIDEPMLIGAISTFVAPGGSIQQIEYCYASTPFAETSNSCVYPDGSTQPGSCMWDEEFSGSSLPSDLIAMDDWVGPILDLTPENGCIVSANATVSGGNLNLTMSANSRSSCPQTWTANAYYNTHSGSSWPTGQPTTYDTAWINQRTFSATYGLVSARIMMPAGSGPGGDITLSGVDCQGTNGTINAAFAGPLWTNSAGPCNFPQSGEIDITEFNKSNGVVDSAVYVGATPGSPPFLGTLFTPPVNYYGALWSNMGGTGNPYLGNPTISDPSANWHIYAVDWEPQSLRWYVDGRLVAINSAAAPTWIPAMPMFVYVFNQDTTTVTLANLPKTMLVDWIRWTCTAPGPSACPINHAEIVDKDRNEFIA